MIVKVDGKHYIRCVAIAYHEVVDEIKRLDLKGKIMIKEYCEQLIHDERRAELVRNVESGMKELAAGKMKTYNSMKELRAALDAD